MKKSTNNKYQILDLRYMPLAHVTKSGNVSIPKKWREELGIKPNSKVILRREDKKIVLETLEVDIKEALEIVGKEIKSKNIKISKEEAIQDELYE